MIFIYIFKCLAIFQMMFMIMCTLHTNKIIADAEMIIRESKTMTSVREYSFKQWMFCLAGYTVPVFIIMSFFFHAWIQTIAIFIIAIYIHGNILVKALRTAAMVYLFLTIIFS